MMQKDSEDYVDLASYISLATENNDPKSELWLGNYYLKKGQVGDGALLVTAVEWLVKASRQGDEEATQVLKTCLDKGLGVTEDNAEDVGWCVRTPQLEKIIRKSARDIFKKLNPLDEQEVTVDDFKSQLDLLPLDEREKRLVEKTASKLMKRKTLNENDFADKLVKRTMYGFGGLQSLLQSDVEMETYKSASLAAKLFRYPGKSVHLAVDNVLELAGSQGLNWVRSLVPTTQIYMLLVLSVYSQLSQSVVMTILPLLLFYPALCAVVITTLQMFYSQRKLKDVEATGRLLQRFNTALDPDSVTSTYQLNSLTPYLTYFSCLPVLVLGFHLSPLGWVPCAELSCLSLLFTIVCFQGLNDRYDKFALISIMLDIISTLPDILPEFLYNLSPVHLLFSGLTLEVLPSVVLNLTLPSIAYLCIPFILISMAAKNSWRGTYQLLIPHLVCFFWWQTTVLFLHRSTWLGLARASVGYVALLIFFPLLVVMSFVWLLYYLTAVLTIWNVVRLVTTMLLLALPVLLGLWAKSGFQVHSFSLTQKSIVSRSILVALFVMSSVPLLMYVGQTEPNINKERYISWPQYKDLCSKPQWKQTNIAHSMILCQHLENTLVEWTGQIKKITIKETRNQAENIVKWLPYSVGDWLRCTYGEQYPSCSEVVDLDAKRVCELVLLQPYHSCHLNHLNKYVFDVWVAMPVDNGSFHDIRLEASDWFKDILLKLKDEDTVIFRASLQKQLGNVWPELKLHYLQCTSCKDNIAFGSKTFISETSWTLLKVIQRGVMETWNFFMAPLIQMKPPVNINY